MYGCSQLINTTHTKSKHSRDWAHVSWFCVRFFGNSFLSVFGTDFKQRKDTTYDCIFSPLRHDDDEWNVFGGLLYSCVYTRGWTSVSPGLMPTHRHTQMCAVGIDLLFVGASGGHVFTFSECDCADRASDIWMCVDIPYATLDNVSSSIIAIRMYKPRCRSKM